MKEELLLHILTGEASPDEKKQFYSHLAESKENEELYFQVKSLWLRTSMKHTRIDTNSEFNRLWEKITEQKRTRIISLISKFARYAAILVFVLTLGGVIGYFFNNNNPGVSYSGVQKYTAMRGSVSVVELDDGTKIWLNSESELSYYQDAEKMQRCADLKGEAFFEIAHNEEMPFVVNVGNIIVRDLGTVFNIKAYAEDNIVETSLVEGKAEILSAGSKQLLELNPGESALYFTNENRIEVRSIENNVLSAWRDGKFVIRNERLEDICKELGRWYGVEFQFENKELLDYRFTGNIKKSTTVQHVLKVLKTSSGFNYRIIENIEKPDLIIVY